MRCSYPCSPTGTNGTGIGRIMFVPRRVVWPFHLSITWGICLSIKANLSGIKASNSGTPRVAVSYDGKLAWMMAQVAMTLAAEVKTPYSA